MSIEVDERVRDRIRKNIQGVTDRIEKTCSRCGRSPDDIALIAVTKTVDMERIYAAVEAGLHVFGENYIQEAKKKISEMQEPVEWHFIGHLQRNKAKYAVRLFDLIHTVDSLRLAAELQKRAEAINKKQPVLVEVNVSGETSKAGIAPGDLQELLKFISRTSHLQVKGLMTMPPYFLEPEKARPYFIKLREIRDHMKGKFPALELEHLSMGMSGDFEVAIEEGSTMIRVGTALFGKREYY